MKVGIIVFVLASACVVCYKPDPRVPLDQARQNINDIQAYQAQTEPLRPLQMDFQKTLLRDSRVQNPSVGFYFDVSSSRTYGARLVVRYVVLLELDKNNMPSTQPDELDKYVQDLVRDALAMCGWEIESVDTYRYENQWRVCGTIRGLAKPASAGAGLDILPERHRTIAN